jgi:peptidoglycan glycosyltransferase
VISRVVSAVALVALLPVIAYGVWRGNELSDGRWLVLLAVGWALGVVAVWPRLPRPHAAATRTIVNTSFVLMSIFVLLTAQLVRAQAIHGDATAHRVARDPKSGEVIANPRLVNADLAINRGAIYDRNGQVIAQSADGNAAERSYPDPATAYVAGYFSPLLYGKSGLESTYDEELSGAAGGNPLKSVLNKLLGRTTEGNDLQLTLDANLQDTAHTLLDGRPGAIVVIDVKTGAVLTIASNPHYDPNQLDVLNQSDRDAATAYWANLQDDPSRPLVLRATNGLFTPGSTYKVITAAAALDSGKANPNTIYTDTGILDIDGHILHGDNRPDDTVDKWTLTQGLAYSLNIVFAQVGLELGKKLLTEYAHRFGLDHPLPFDLPVATSRLSNDDNFLDTDPAVADTAFGQGQLQVTPLEMALVAASIANGGKMMAPYLVDRVTSPGGDTLDRHKADVLRQPVSNKTADQVKAMMINAVENGYVNGAHIDGFTVGGKTGTAETGNEEPHAWFIGFIGDPNPRYAVAVVLEHGGSGLTEPVRIGREMLLAAMQAGD